MTRTEALARKLADQPWDTLADEARADYQARAEHLEASGVVLADTGWWLERAS